MTYCIYCLVKGVRFFIHLLPIIAIAQISGVTTDNKTGKPLSGVEIFINKTTIVGQSDESGRFMLEGKTTGFQEIILFKKGYELYRSYMKINADRQYKLQLSLVPQKKKKASTLSGTEIALLKNKFRNPTPDDSITFLNVEQIGVTTVSSQRILTGPTPLIIENNKTGYKQYYYLDGSSFETINQTPVWFESLLSQKVQQSIVWEQNRNEYFKGSLRHWLMAMVADQTDKEGYLIKNMNGRDLSSQSFFSKSALSDYFKLQIDQPLTIVFKDADGEERISEVKTNGPLDVNARGLVINAKSLDAHGDMANTSLADQLPADYEPIVGDVEEVYAQTIERFYEKVYVHTDKPYYYPGEPLWFKGYIHYKEPRWRDSLSKVIYVELISPDKKVTLEKTLKIDSGIFYNDFILPDSLKEGTYYLRAYTNLNRNFGDSLLFTKSIPILNVLNVVVNTQGKMGPEPSPELLITSDKKIYKPREKIILTVQAKDKEGKVVSSNVSVSVMDAIQVTPVEESVTILNAYHFSDKQKTIKELKYPVEYGVNLRGRYLNDKGLTERTTLTFLQLKPRSMMMTTTDEQGLFTQAGLDFYDTATFSFKAEREKDFPYGKIELLPREVAAMNFKETNPVIMTQSTQSKQRIISEYEAPKDTRVLEGIEVKARRIEEQYEKDYRVKRPYGKPDYVLKSKDINASYGNLLMAIQGRFPGLVVRLTENGWVVYTLRSVGNSISNGKDILVTVNNVPLGGLASDALSTIDPFTVESIEVTTRINVLYGSQGAAGVIAIYTKQGVSSESDTPHSSGFQRLVVKGYDIRRKFKSPDYSGDQALSKTVDYRSTIYWVPNLITNSKNAEASVSFFAADLPGKYRISVEGVLENGEPVRSVCFIDIENN